MLGSLASKDAREHLATWRAPDRWWKIETLDAHTAGEPFRIVVGGFPEPRGETILERRRHVQAHYEHLRRAIMLEPRGHADMYGCLVMAPASPDAHLGVLFMHNEGWSTMCGHGIIGLVAALAQTGAFPGGTPDPILIDAPAGRIRARVIGEGTDAPSVSFLNVPSFVAALDAVVDVPGLGAVTYDLAYGGAFYAFVDARSVGLDCDAGSVAALIDAGKRIKRAIVNQVPIAHPEDDDLGFLYGVIFTGPAEAPDRHSRHVCVFADGEVDRSPTGTGVSARLALLHARGGVRTGQQVTIESIVGGCFEGRVVEETTVAGRPAVVPEVGGRAYLTGRHTFFIDPDDPFRDGFLLR